MKVLSISNIKGGIAKTTTTATLASGLHHRGYKVLMIDADPQSNLTMCFIKEPEDDDAPSLYHIYSKGHSINEVKISIKSGLDLVVGDFSLCSADMEFFGRVGSLKVLYKAIKEVRDQYDFVLIDTPPNLGFLSLNAFMASDYIVTPMSADSFSLKAIRLLKKTIDDVSDEAEKDIPVIGILLTRYNERTNIVKLLEESISTAANLLDTSLFNARIRQATVVQESQLAKMDLYEYAPKSPVTRDYDNFVDELLQRLK